MAIKKVPDIVLLSEFIIANMVRRFAWWEFDCVTACLQWVEKARGIDYLDKLEPWHDERSAVREIRRVGGLECAADGWFTRVDPNHACDGSIALFDRSICIFSGEHIVGPGVNGLTFKSRMDAKCAWAI